MIKYSNFKIKYEFLRNNHQQKRRECYLKIISPFNQFQIIYQANKKRLEILKEARNVNNSSKIKILKMKLEAKYSIAFNKILFKRQRIEETWQMS